MPLYQNQGGTLTLINAVKVQSEKVLQRLLEDNLKDILDMHFIASEYRTTNGRIDTLAVDREGAPVIIEYKRCQNNNVINQALSYLQWLRAQQAEFFEMLMQKQLPQEVFDNIRLDWKHPRVICVAESFSRYDVATVEMVPLRIELFKYRMYEGGLISIDAVAVNEMQGVSDSSKTITAETSLSVTTAMKEQCSASHLIRTLFDELRERIMGLDPYIVEKAGKRCISYKLTKNFAEVLIRKDWIVIDLRPIDFEDPRGMIERIAASYTVTLNRRVTLISASDLDYIFGLIEQSYQNVL